MQAELMTNGPIESGFMVYKDFSNYKSGVYIYDGSSEALGGHAIRIVGWGTEDGVDYWLVANSWGSNWGEDGVSVFFRSSHSLVVL
jgi:cathepsin B